MVLDTSAIIAILLHEKERDSFIDAIADDPVRLMSSVNALEAALVIEAQKGEAGGREFDLLLHRATVDVVPFLQEHVEEARNTWRRFGKGNHSAGLNFCDCCAYALSQLSGEALLFKGDDFKRTEVVAAVPDTTEPAAPCFSITLEPTYYRQGFFNVRAEHERYFGQHRSAIEIHVPGGHAPIMGVINRTANRNGTPRIHGYTALLDYFHSNFDTGDRVMVAVESPQRIRIEPDRPQPSSRRLG